MFQARLHRSDTFCREPNDTETLTLPRLNLEAHLKRIRSAPRHLAEIFRFLGNRETSRFEIIGALFWFVMFGGIWLLMLIEIGASWLDIPFHLIVDDSGPVTFGDFVISTFFASMMVFITGNILYGRFFMSREEIDVMVGHWSDNSALTFVVSSSGPYSWNAFRFFLRLSAGVCILMVLSLVFLPFLE